MCRYRKHIDRSMKDASIRMCELLNGTATWTGNVNALYGICDKEYKIHPSYEQTSREPSPHEPIVFTVSCKVGERETVAWGATLKSAKDHAAGKMIELLNSTKEPPHSSEQSGILASPEELDPISRFDGRQGTGTENATETSKSAAIAKPIDLVSGTKDGQGNVSTLYAKCGRDYKIKPSYEEKFREALPNNVIMFTVSCNVAERATLGRGTSLKSANDRAAANMLELLCLEDERPSLEQVSSIATNASTVDTDAADQAVLSVSFSTSDNESSDAAHPGTSRTSRSPERSQAEQVVRHYESKDWICVDRDIFYDPSKPKGKSSNVFTGEYRNAAGSVKPVAVKKIPKHEHLEAKDLQLLINMDHPNIVRYMALEQCPVTKDFCLAMQLASYSLEEFVQLSKYKTRYHYLQKRLLETTNGLDYLHSRKPEPIIHRDIKPANILMINRGGQFVAALCDFGISKVSQAKFGNTTKTRGTLNWMPPEALGAYQTGRDIKAYPSLDIFSLGLTMFYTMGGGHHAFGSDGELTIPSNILNPRRKPDWHRLNFGVHDSLKFEIMNMLQSLMDKDQRTRVGRCQLILEHPFFWDLDRKLDFFIDVSNDMKMKKIQEPKTKTKVAKKEVTKEGHSSAPVDCTRKPNPQPPIQQNTLELDEREMLETSYRQFCELWNRTAKLRPELHPRPPDNVWCTGDTINWNSRMCHVVKVFLTRRKDPKTYNSHRIIHLIEFIRDHWIHKVEWVNDPEMTSTSVFGLTKETYGKYFVTRFPELIPFLYTYFQNSRLRGTDISRYYKVNGTGKAYLPLTKLPLFED